MPRFGRLLSLVLLTSVGCVSVRGVERGPYVDREAIAQRHEDRQFAAVQDDRAFLTTRRKTCTTWRERYGELQVQDVTHPSYGFLLTGLTLSALGGALVYYGMTDDTDHGASMKATTGEKALIFGVPLAIMGPLMAGLSGAEGNQSHETRRVPTRGQQFAPKITCQDQAFRVQEALDWDLALGPTHLRGKTGPGGTLAVTPAILGLLRTAPVPLAAQPLAQGKSLQVELRLADTAPIRLKVDPASVSQDLWQAWADVYERSLPPDRQLRWNACTALAPSPRGAIECLWRQDGLAGKLLTFDGQLARTEAGEYGAALEFQGRQGDAFTLRLLLPGPDLDWLVQVVRLDTGAVVAQSFSGASRRLDLSGSLPATGDHAVILNAVRPGAYRSVLTVGPK